RVDINRDKSVSAKEMQRWIMEKTEEHFQQAVKENKLSFRAVDPDGDDTFVMHYSSGRGMIVFNYTWTRRMVSENVHNNQALKMPHSFDEVLDNLKDRWFQADGPPADQLLNEEEFLSFLHPEHSRGMLKFMVKEIVRDLGACPPIGATSELNGSASGWEGFFLAFHLMRLSQLLELPAFSIVAGSTASDLKTFQKTVSRLADHTRSMQLVKPREYMDPMNEYNALNEAKQMIAVADENQNRNLELEEILKYSEYFTGSKLMDYARNVHEEF
uniref:Stromal cell derived factor 4 n=1 Tax=Lepisosteus oculatus TaxID=7918 RepID=W5M2Y5_LEPOC